MSANEVLKREDDEGEKGIYANSETDADNFEIEEILNEKEMAVRTVAEVLVAVRRSKRRMCFCHHWQELAEGWRRKT